MIIHLRKSAHESVMTCTRDDGSVTYQKTRHAVFFPRHDLMHYAIESTLGLKNSFYGLVASGWSLDAFSEPGMSRRLPLEARHTEFIVGEMDRLMMFAEPIRSEAFNAFLTQAIGGDGSGPLTLHQEQLDAIALLFNTLYSEYCGLEDGGHLELVFPETNCRYIDHGKMKSA
jgi:hypothetical protein